MVVGHRAVGVAVELRELVHILPHRLVVGVEDVGTVAVDVDALHRLRVDVTRDVISLIDDEAALARLLGLVGKHCAVQTGTDDQVIILFHISVPRFLFLVSVSGTLFFCAARYWSMAVWMRARAASGVMCLS